MVGKTVHDKIISFLTFRPNDEGMAPVKKFPLAIYWENKARVNFPDDWRVPQTHRESPAPIEPSFTGEIAKFFNYSEENQFQSKVSKGKLENVG